MQSNGKEGKIPEGATISSCIRLFQEKATDIVAQKKGQIHSTSFWDFEKKTLRITSGSNNNIPEVDTMHIQ